MFLLLRKHWQKFWTVIIKCSSNISTQKAQPSRFSCLKFGSSRGFVVHVRPLKPFLTHVDVRHVSLTLSDVHVQVGHMQQDIGQGETQECATRQCEVKRHMIHDQSQFVLGQTGFCRIYDHHRNYLMLCTGICNKHELVFSWLKWAS